jgi:hypothetical protein
MPAVFAVKLRGTKAEAHEQIDAQVPEEKPDARAALHSLINAAPGTRVSFAGAMSAAEDGSSGSININGSFWTKAEA